MTVEELKERIIEDDAIEDVLLEIGCHHIRKHDGYYTCGNKDGDNPSAITVYNNENLTVVNYTRQIAQNKRTTDIFDLVMYNQDITFPEALKFVCEMFGLDYYSEPTEKPVSLIILQMLNSMSVGEEEDDISPLKPISEQILSYYLPYGNKMFEDDGISLETQKEWGIGYDARTNRITIPIRDSLGSLVGVKGRLLKDNITDCDPPKYLYIEKCNRSRILYGAYENREYIKNNKYLYITEAEKGPLQLASNGIRNCVATCGKTISKTQIELIVRTGCAPVFLFDKDVKFEELQSIADNFMDGIDVYAVIDTEDILDEKESPTDNIDKFNKLIQNIQKIK